MVEAAVRHVIALALVISLVWFGWGVGPPVPSDRYRQARGTSMSAALVAGSVASLRARCPHAGRFDVLVHLFATARQLDDLPPLLQAGSLLRHCPEARS